MIVASLLLSLPFLDRPVTLESSGDSVAAIADLLSEKAGAKIKAGPSVRKQILVVQVRERPLKQLLDEVGKALGATWTERAGEITIYRTDAQEKAQIAAERKAKIDALKEWQSAPIPSPLTEAEAKSIVMRAEVSAKDFLQHQDQSRHFQEMNALAKLSPATRAAFHVRKGLDLNRIAEVGFGVRYTFSSNPNRLQLPLKGGEEAIERYARETELMRAEATASLERVPRSQSVLDVRMWPELAIRRADEVLVAAYRLPNTPQLLIRTYFVSQGKIRGWVSDSVAPKVSAKTPLPKIDFKVSPQTAHLSERNEKVTEQDRELLRQRVDPAGWVMGPLIRDYAAARNLDLVACVSDSATNVALTQSLKSRTPMTVLSSLMNLYGSWSEHDGTLIITPDNPAESRSRSMDRDAFWKYVEQMGRDGHPTLEAAGDYLAQESIEPVCDNVLNRAAVIQTGQYVNYAFWGSAPILKFWGSMPAQNREKSTAIGQLSGPAKATLNQWIYGTNLGLQALDVDVDDPTSGWDIGRLEPTERFPNGLPGDMTVTCSIEKTPIIWQRYDESKWSSRLEDCYDLVDRSDSATNSVALETQRVLNLRFFYEKLMRVQLDEPPRESNLSWTPVDKLPAETLKELRALKAKSTPTERPVRGTPPPTPRFL